MFWISCVLPHGFQIQSGYLACTLSCLHAMILKVTTGVTPAFSTNSGVHCINMYTAWLTRLLSHASEFEPPRQWCSTDVLIKPTLRVLTWCICISCSGCWFATSGPRSLFGGTSGMTSTGISSSPFSSTSSTTTCSEQDTVKRLSKD